MTISSKNKDSYIDSPWISIHLWFLRTRFGRWFWWISSDLYYRMIRLIFSINKLFPNINGALKEFNNGKKMHYIKQRESFNFIKAFIINPRATGAILPSSKYLAKLMASFDEIDKNKLVIELGPGTGVVTQALLDAGISAKRLVAIEYAPHLVKALSRKFPEIEIINGNAAQLSDLLKNEKRQIGTVISGLPLRSLPKEMRESILYEICKILIHGGHYLQFTYDFRKNTRFYPKIYHLKKSKIVWRNIPPAKIQLFTLGKQCKDNQKAI